MPRRAATIFSEERLRFGSCRKLLLYLRKFYNLKNKNVMRGFVRSLKEGMSVSLPQRGRWILRSKRRMRRAARADALTGSRSILLLPFYGRR